MTEDGDARNVDNTTSVVAPEPPGVMFVVAVVVAVALGPFRLHCCIQYDLQAAIVVCSFVVVLVRAKRMDKAVRTMSRISGEWSVSTPGFATTA